MIELELFHTQEYRVPLLTFPVLARGLEQWLGDGFYFWEDYEVAKWWGNTKKCGRRNTSRQFSVFKVKVAFEGDSYIDTVFNEEDYRNFVLTIEDFAKRYSKKFKKKPTLEEFNDFIQDFGIWEDIKVIRFQDVPENDTLVEVTGFYYKKRIQFRVKDPEIIVNFAHLKDFGCV
jgi:hypothetical protein